MIYDEFIAQADARIKKYAKMRNNIAQTPSMAQILPTIDRAIYVALKQREYWETRKAAAELPLFFS